LSWRGVVGAIASSGIGAERFTRAVATSAGFVENTGALVRREAVDDTVERSGFQWAIRATIHD
jgi:hypothetical protein